MEKLNPNVTDQYKTLPEAMAVPDEVWQVQIKGREMKYQDQVTMQLGDMEQQTSEFWIANEIAQFSDEMHAEDCIKENINYRYYRKVGDVFAVYEEQLIN